MYKSDEKIMPLLFVTKGFLSGGAGKADMTDKESHITRLGKTILAKTLNLVNSKCCNIFIFNPQLD